MSSSRAARSGAARSAQRRCGAALAAPLHRRGVAGAASSVASQQQQLQQLRQHCQQRRPVAVMSARRADDDVQPVPPAPLATSDAPEDLERDAECEDAGRGGGV